MGDTHRVAIKPASYQAARRYMVAHGLPHVRAAVEAMIEAQEDVESPGEQDREHPTGGGTESGKPDETPFKGGGQQAPPPLESHDMGVAAQRCGPRRTIEWRN